MDPAKKRFVLGILLAWTPWIPTLLCLLYFIMRDMSRNKATGLGAVAGGISEMLVLWGFSVMILTQVASIVLLSRSLSREHIARSLAGALSIGLSAIMLALMGGYVWVVCFLRAAAESRR